MRNARHMYGMEHDRRRGAHGTRAIYACMHPWGVACTSVEHIVHARGKHASVRVACTLQHTVDLVWNHESNTARSVEQKPGQDDHDLRVALLHTSPQTQRNART